MKNQRRIFLIGSAFLIGTLPLFSYSSTHYAKKVSIHKEPYQTVALVHEDLFVGSSLHKILHNINAVSFLRGVFEDTYITQDEKHFLHKGVLWLHETSQELYKKQYYHLSPQERQNVLHVISQKNWGDSWLWSVMSYFFEAMLGDPLYGGNIDKSGWHNLDLISGYPRPKKVLYHG